MVCKKCGEYFFNGHHCPKCNEEINLKGQILTLISTYIFGIVCVGDIVLEREYYAYGNRTISIVSAIACAVSIIASLIVVWLGKFQTRLMAIPATILCVIGGAVFLYGFIMNDYLFSEKNTWQVMGLATFTLGLFPFITLFISMYIVVEITNAYKKQNKNKNQH